MPAYIDARMPPELDPDRIIIRSSDRVRSSHVSSHDRSTTNREQPNLALEFWRDLRIKEGGVQQVCGILLRSY
jgi:hypothetical protein